MVAPVCIMETPVTVVSTLASSSPDFCWSFGLIYGYCSCYRFGYMPYKGCSCQLIDLLLHGYSIRVRCRNGYNSFIVQES